MTTSRHADRNSSGSWSARPGQAAAEGAAAEDQHRRDHRRDSQEEVPSSEPASAVSALRRERTEEEDDRDQREILEEEHGGGPSGRPGWRSDQGKTRAVDDKSEGQPQADTRPGSGRSG